MSTSTEVKTKWALDPAHSEIQFKVKHLMITTVTGSFSTFDGSVETEGDDFSTASISFKAKIDSITTNNEQRDTHLKSDDFFGAENYPYLNFEGGKLSKIGDSNEYTLKGNLTIKDVTKEVELNAEMGGIQKDPWGNEKAGFSINGKINRKNFGLTWNAITEGGGMLVSEDIRIIAEIQLARK
ncbi:MAG: YceI family protein [Bacteroidia bacterium]